MSDHTINWQLVDQVAIDLDAKQEARLKWRQRGVPAKWRILIAQELMRRGVPVALSDFDRLPENPGRIAA